MDNIELRYTVDLPEFCKATKHSLLRSFRGVIKAVAVILALSITYVAVAVATGRNASFFVITIIAICFLWITLVILNFDKIIKRYSKSKDSLVNCEYIAQFDNNYVRFTVPDHGVNLSCQYGKLDSVRELSDLFLVFLSSKELFPISKRSLSQEQIVSLRKLFRQKIPDRFTSKK